MYVVVVVYLKLKQPGSTRMIEPYSCLYKPLYIFIIRNVLKNPNQLTGLPMVMGATGAGDRCMAGSTSGAL